jgi:hypothetical protein
MKNWGVDRRWKRRKPTGIISLLGQPHWDLDSQVWFEPLGSWYAKSVEQTPVDGRESSTFRAAS